MSDNKWYHNTGKTGDIVVSTRIRLARNLANYPFPARLTPDERQAVNKAFADALIGSDSSFAGEFRLYELEKLTPQSVKSLVECHLISPEFASNPKNAAILLNDDRSVSIMLCEEDHMRLQIMAPGLSLYEAYDTADKIDSLLDNALHFAFDKRLGYLTSCPTNLGTGMRASIMLHLPALEAAGGIEALAKSVSKIGLCLRGTFGENSGALGALYQLSNQISLGIDEKSALDNLSNIAEQVIEQEKAVRDSLPRLSTEDKIFRSLGILQNARLISTKEFFDHISYVRLGVSMGLIKGLSVETINALCTDMQAATLLCANPDADTPEKRDRLRAAMVREEISGAKQF